MKAILQFLSVLRFVGILLKLIITISLQSCITATQRCTSNKICTLKLCRLISNALNVAIYLVSVKCYIHLKCWSFRFDLVFKALNKRGFSYIHSVTYFLKVENDAIFICVNNQNQISVTIGNRFLFSHCYHLFNLLVIICYLSFV